jgi:hypothetical protein
MIEMKNQFQTYSHYNRGPPVEANCINLQPLNEIQNLKPMIYPEYTDMPMFESAEGKTVTFERPSGTREGAAHLMIYHDGLEIRLITEKTCLHTVFIYFTIRGKCAGLVSKKKYNRYTLTLETLLPMALDIRKTFQNMSFSDSSEINTIDFKVGNRPNSI